MALRFHSEEIKDKYEKKAHKVIFFSMALLLIPVAYIIVQFMNGIISPFNLIPLGVLVMILIGAVKSTLPKHKKENDKGLFYEENFGLSEEEKQQHKEENLKNLEAENYFIVPLSKPAMFLRWAATLLMIVAGIVMFCLGPKIYSTENYTTVTATIISQKGEYHTDTTYYENGGSSSTSYSRCKLEIAYNFKGESKTETIYVNGVEYVYSENFEILLDSNGKYVRTSVESTKFYIFAGLLIFTGILLGLSAYYKTSSIIFLAAAFILIGGAILIFVCMPVSIKEFLYAHFASIPFMFVIIAIYWFSCFIITPVLLPRDLSKVGVLVAPEKKGKLGAEQTVYREKRGNQYVIRRVDENTVDQKSEPLQESRCEHCGNVLEEGAKFCTYCGAKRK